MAEVSVSLQIFVVPGIELSISCKLSKNSITELIPQGQSALTTKPFYFSLSQKAFESLTHALLYNRSGCFFKTRRTHLLLFLAYFKVQPNETTLT